MSDPWVQTYYRGAAYPLELTQPAFGQDGTGCCLRVVDRLLDLCAQNIVRDARTTLAALKIIPTELSVNLMRAALTGNRDRSIHVLLSHWPYDVLRLESLAPPLFTSVLPLYNNTHLNYIARMGIRFTSTLAHYFAQCLKMKCNMKLKFLDITGFVTVDKVTDYIVSNCLLANNESRMKKISEALNALKEEGEAEGKPLPYNIDHTMSEGCYCVKFDVFVNSVNTHTELCKALHVCKFKSSSFKLLINKLDATFLGEVKLKVLLKLIDPEHLTALRLQFNSLGEHGIIHLSSSISSLTNLTALDLSCNGIHFFHSQDSCNQVAAMLASLPHLARLDLSNNRLKTRLRQLLCGLTRPLQYLAVVGCCLAVSDVTYLSLSHHTAGLTEIDLSENWSVGQNTRSLLTLLHALGEQIMVLEIQNCAMGDNELTELLAVLPSLTELRYLNLSFNDLCWDSSARCVRAGTRLSNFKALQLSYPRECHTELGDGEDAMTKENFKHQMTAIIQDQKNKTGVSFDFSLLDTY